jgi:hypothetical protein
MQTAGAGGKGATGRGTQCTVKAKVCCVPNTYTHDKVATTSFQFKEDGIRTEKKTKCKLCATLHVSFVPD